MSHWTADKEWSDQFLPEIKRILGEHLIGAAPVEEDMQRNTDLIVLKMEAVRIACRVRRAGKYLQQYGDQFTIRTSRPPKANGECNKTELQKILESFGNYFFYAFGEEDSSLARWTLGDLNVFRGWFYKQLVRLDPGKYPGIPQKNKDGSSGFCAFRWDEIPGMVVAKHWPQRQPAATHSQEPEEGENQGVWINGTLFPY